MTDLKQLVSNIEQWAEARNLIEGSTPEKQFLKLLEEFGELCSGISKGKLSVIKDSIGDCFVVLTILSAQRKRNEIDSVFSVSNFIDCELKGLSKKTISIPEKWIIQLLHDLRNLSIDMERNMSIHDIFRGVLIDLVCICNCFNIDFMECVEIAWNEIKDRKGRMIEGVFVKEEDL